MNRERSSDPGGGLPGNGARAQGETALARPSGGAGVAAARETTSEPDGHEQRLVARVFNRWQGLIAEACYTSSVPADFLGALVANESRGDPRALRFEPAVYRHLRLLAEGRCPAYAGLTRRDLDDEVVEMLRPKAPPYHARHLGDAFAAANAPALALSTDDALRDLASSWGLTQIMGYHLAGRAGTVRDLVEPRFHLRLALELLAEFAERYQLDARREFAEMFRCWNTGQPYGQTFDPAYVPKGLRRMEIYRAIWRSRDRATEPLSH